jgi:hypothetical protein
MKLNKIAALCRNRKKAVIFKCHEERHNQWIGDGVAMFPVEGLPTLDKTALLTIFNVPEKDRAKWMVAETEMPLQYDVSGYQENESEVTTSYMGIAHAGEILKPIYTKRGVIFVDARYLLPLADVVDLLDLAVRWTQSGDPYIIARAGFLIQAIILPKRGIAPDFAASVRELATACDKAVEEQRAKARKDNPAQYEMNVDKTAEAKEAKTKAANRKPSRAVKGGANG